mmetsp:Transcript_3088/g.4414  ORF Transcript_3088/g.4414 Transcript_3088/m.4414 type:complete len:95 (-) Transcript_3088:257-541(-)
MVPSIRNFATTISILVDGVLSLWCSLFASSTMRCESRIEIHQMAAIHCEFATPTSKSSNIYLACEHRWYEETPVCEAANARRHVTIHPIIQSVL